MKNKKLQAMMELMTYGSAILVAIIILVFFDVIPKYNPDIHVCEEWKCTIIQNDGFTIKQQRQQCYDGEDEECSKFRKKTTGELQIDDCNSNPREDSDCKCEEYKDSETIIGSHGENCRNISVQNCKVNGLYHYNQGIQFKGKYLKWSDTCELELQFEMEVTDIKNFSMEIYEENITNCDLTYDYEQICSKARPLTDQEKYPEDYIIETEQKIDWDRISINQQNNSNFNANLSDRFYKCLKNKCDIMIEDSTINKQLHDERKDIMVEYEGCSIQCYQKLNISYINQTTYRLKNEARKPIELCNNI